MNKKLFVLGKEKLKSKASMFKNVDNSIGLSHLLNKSPCLLMKINEPEVVQVTRQNERWDGNFLM